LTKRSNPNIAAKHSVHVVARPTDLLEQPMALATRKHKFTSACSPGMPFQTGVLHALLMVLLACLIGLPVAAQTTRNATKSAPVQEAPTATASAGSLQREINDLGELRAGRLPPETALAALFEIDLTDSAAIGVRVQSLQKRLSATPEQSDPKAADISSLRRTRDALRLAFLQLPTAQRDALVEQDRLRSQSEAMAAEQARAVEAITSNEQARDIALTTANATADDTSRMLATEEARLLTHLSELSSLRQSWAQRQQLQLQKYQALLAHFGDVSAGATLSAAQADLHYNEIRGALRQLRDEAHSALSKLTDPTSVMQLGAGMVIDAQTALTHTAEVNRIRALRTQIAAEEKSLTEREATVRYGAAEDVMNALRTLQAQRVALLPRLSAQRQSDVTGISGDGLERVLSEVAHLRLMARWYPVQRLHDVTDLAQRMRKSFNVGGLGTALFWIIILAVGLAILPARLRTWMGKLRASVAPAIASIALRRLAISTLHTLIRVTGELTLLLGVYLCFDVILVGHLALPELVALRSLAYAFAWYRVALALIHRVLLTAISRYQLVEPSLNTKILRSLRMVARLALWFVMYLTLAQAMLGRGALYGIAREIAVFGAIFVGWLLLRAWRTEVTSAYLSIFPEGRLADRVRASQENSQGLFVALAAFVFVAARGVWVWLRDTALRFEQTRKALAYLFRRQLERKAKNQSAPPDPALLPVELQNALTEEAVSGALGIDVYPKVDAVSAIALDLPNGKRGALIALSGERGAGKTTWLLALQKRLADKLPCTLYAIAHRDPTVGGVCAVLCDALNLTPTSDPNAVIDQLNQLPPQVVLLDLVQNTFLRDVGGLAGHQALIRIAQATTSHMVWVLTYAHWPFEFVQRTQPDRDVYDRKVMLKPWSEPQICALLDTRIAQAGFTVDYEKLFSEPGLPKPVIVHGQIAHDELERSADRYHRLVWDYADGNPRIALHFFRLSLVFVRDKHVDVRLFSMPQVDDLEPFETSTWFTLACLVQHENLTVEEAVRSLRFSAQDCERALTLLQSHGFLNCHEGRYRVESHWSRAVLRFLHRKKLLAV
jgi:hypothetical protein